MIVFRVPEDYEDLQQALDAVTHPTTILLAPGIYAGGGVEHKEYVVLQSTNLSRRGVTLSSTLSITKSVIHLSGIEIRTDQRGRGIHAEDSYLTLQECVVAGNRAHDLGAGIASRRSTVRLQKSVIAGNTVDSNHDGSGAGAYFDECKVEIAGCTFQANVLYAVGQGRGAGISCTRSRLRMWRSRVTDNAMYATSGEGGGIHLVDSIDAQIGGSVVTGNGGVNVRGGGIFVSGGNVSIHRNTVVRHNHQDDVWN